MKQGTGNREQNKPIGYRFPGKDCTITIPLLQWLQERSEFRLSTNNYSLVPIPCSLLYSHRWNRVDDRNASGWRELERAVGNRHICLFAGKGEACCGAIGLLDIDCHDGAC